MQLAVAGRVIAVRRAEAARQSGEAIRILSGVPMPQGADIAAVKSASSHQLDRCHLGSCLHSSSRAQSRASCPRRAHLPKQTSPQAGPNCFASPNEAT
jgi:hypothetical protein